MRIVPPGAHFGLPTMPGGWGRRTFVGHPQRHTTSNTHQEIQPALSPQELQYVVRSEFTQIAGHVKLSTRIGPLAVGGMLPRPIEN